ncbi:hypothetical protein HG535_0F02870 [Zygotorulaspora mrakii]|uniref:Telomere replication protein EST3 n=1 Tax=Zygotorulaspora mrakii TaxID=42260 RepID=A0A7H9B637_ZYGMR|nr:uncharacterized protein HG535_0F02870 [Zygotorulaspora mrakii]QLG73776.1 hypothetical protein HG535_0F02870 [Zygotorulaspora mrakii]
MPRVRLPSSSEQRDAILLQSWLYSRLRMASPKISDTMMPTYSFIPSLSVEDMRNPQLSSAVLCTPCHFVKITKFYRVHNYRVFASVRDNTHQILVVFTPKCVSNFERRYHSRITSHVVNSLIIVGDCSLHYWPPSKIQDNFDIGHNNCAFSEAREANKSLPILIINQMGRFEMDQVEPLALCPFVYGKL